MYFESRSEAGDKLAQKLIHEYRYEDCAIVALSVGAVLVGEQIAKQLHCVMTMLLMEDIEIPGENMAIGAVSHDGTFTYNGMFSAGEIEGYDSEFHGYFEEQKRQSFQHLNRLLGDGGIIDPELLRDRVVILVSDGFDKGSSLDVAMSYLKPIRTKKIVVAAPIATVSAVDKLHIVADELHILDVKQNFLGINHYYDDNTIPAQDETIEKINKIILNWS